jgi:hypothetical protein
VVKHLALVREKTNSYRISVQKSDGKRPLGRSKRRWEDNIKIDLQKVGYGARTDLAQLTGGGLL